MKRKMIPGIIVLVIILTIVLFYSCKTKKVKSIEPVIVNAEWVKNATIYELNIRQYSEEGTFAAVTADLERLKDLGIDIIWLMPVFPIGKLNRKATQTVLAEEIKDSIERKKYLGSYYSTKDYYSVNPEYGSIEDFIKMVNKIHELNMYVILDIAVNHTAWDHPWIKEHPEYYTRIEKGSEPWNPEWMKQHPQYYNRLKDLGMTYPLDFGETDWWDAADLNYDNDSLRNEIKEVFRYWVKKYNIDGYRCDVAGLVPTDFWNEVRVELDNIKPVFMLAEADKPELHEKAFDASYDWKLHHTFSNIAKEEKPLNSIYKHFAMVDTVYPKNSILMQFTTNHDENSWNGTVYERFGYGVEAFAVLTFTLPGMPLIYSGQEASMDKRLKFFEKDPIEWRDYDKTEFYQILTKLKKENPALKTGIDGGELVKIENNASSNILSFLRDGNKNKILVIVNLSPEKTLFKINSNLPKGTYKNIFSEEIITMKTGQEIELKSWDYLVCEILKFF